jgi:hypothetical protein
LIKITAKNAKSYCQIQKRYCQILAELPPILGPARDEEKKQKRKQGKAQKLIIFLYSHNQTCQSTFQGQCVKIDIINTVY